MGADRQEFVQRNERAHIEAGGEGAYCADAIMQEMVEIDHPRLLLLDEPKELRDHRRRGEMIEVVVGQGVMKDGAFPRRTQRQARAIALCAGCYEDYIGVERKQALE